MLHNKHIINILMYAEDLYDHLDFLRPTGSWKPHYQKAIAPQDQNSKSSNVDENVV